MPRIRLTDRTIATLPAPESGRADYWDDATPNFGLRITQAGTKTFVVLIAGQKRTLGRYPVLSLAQARENARKALYQAKYDPSPKRSWGYLEAVDAYLKAIEPQTRPATRAQYERYLKRLAFDGLLDDLQSHEIAERIEAIDGQNARAAAHTTLKVFLNWCVQRQYIVNTPMATLKKPKIPKATERILEDQELTAIWNTLQDHPDKRFAIILKLCMISGQRKAQFAHLHESWINYKTKTFNWPASIMKNGEPHSLGFGPLTHYLLTQAQPVKGYYFSPIGMTGRPFTAWGKNKDRLDRDAAIDPWHVHCLRTTWSTNAARLGIDPIVAELVLAHKAPLGAMAARYNRWRYEDEKRNAILRMESHIQELITPLEIHRPLT